MKQLVDSIQKYIKYPHIDAHVHLFDGINTLDKWWKQPSNFTKVVGFADIRFDIPSSYKNHKIVDAYNDFIKDHYNSKKHILLATADNSKDAIEIYKQHSDIIKGFGEFKCYSEYGKDDERISIPYGNLRWLKELFEFNKDINLPVYIHFNLDTQDNIDELEEILKNYSKTPIVLCHFGMTRNKSTNKKISSTAKLLHKKYKNLWLDLSWSSCEYFKSNKDELNDFDLTRIIIGSDLNPDIYSEFYDIHEKLVKRAYDRINEFSYISVFDRNVSRLFNCHDIDTEKVCNELISLYKENISKMDRHSKIHVLSRLEPTGIFDNSELKRELKTNFNSLKDIVNEFDTGDYNKILNEYVLIGYEKKGRKHDIGEIFKHTNNKYKKFLCLITILEMIYTFVRTNNEQILEPIKTQLEHIIDSNINLIFECLKEDEYDFKHNASTKYINCIFFIFNLYKLSDYIDTLDFINRDFMLNLCESFIEMYHNEPSITTIYGLTHILIGASNFYRSKLPRVFDRIITVIESIVNREDIFNSLTFDLQTELVLCCKLFGNNIDIEKYKKIIAKKIKLSSYNLEKNEHTNILYILICKL